MGCAGSGEGGEMSEPCRVKRHGAHAIPHAFFVWIDENPLAGPMTEGAATESAKAINAALTAEWDKRADWNVVIEDLEAAVKSKEAELQAFLADADSARESWMKALDAEQEKFKQMSDAYAESHEILKKERDAERERRKPLVEALESLKTWVKIGEPRSIIDAALASVKEGK